MVTLLVTRELSHDDELESICTANHLALLKLPLIDVIPVSNYEEIVNANTVCSLKSAFVTVFTSANAITYLPQTIKQVIIEKSLYIVSFGKRLNKICRNEFVKKQVMPLEVETSSELGLWISKNVDSKINVVFPCARETSGGLEQSLANLYTLIKVPVYETVFKECTSQEKERVLGTARDVGLLPLFFSPSAVRSFFKQFNELIVNAETDKKLLPLGFACFGTVTQNELKKLCASNNVVYSTFIIGNSDRQSFYTQLFSKLKNLPCAH
jgi:uroporphyrinogen-III synthase